MEHATVLITGASRGLGRALALALARPGRRLVLVARSPGPLEAVANDAQAAGAEVSTIAADIGDPSAATEIAARAFARFGAIDLLIHNASDLGPLPMPLLADTSPEALERVFQVNTFGPFRLTRALLGSMLLGNGGTVVHISSDAAVEAYPHWGAYGASKAATDHLSRIWREELADSGVRFVSIDPGEMDTQMHADALPDADPSALSDPVNVAAALIASLQREAAFARYALDLPEVAQ
jgi:NAD(P)-dependent dehydrogenase (short-subunit alcohol dehydrogenase family)